jgi:hypothetical protein
LAAQGNSGDIKVFNNTPIVPETSSSGKVFRILLLVLVVAALVYFLHNTADQFSSALHLLSENPEPSSRPYRTQWHRAARAKKRTRQKSRLHSV